MEIKFIAFDSFGVKSSCVYVETDHRIIIDPGTAFEASSFPLSLATRLAYDAKYEMKVRRYLRKAEIVIVSHYHYDHHIPSRRIYRKKILLLKDPSKHINKSQMERAEIFRDLDYKIADGRKYEFGGTKISFSKPAWHGVKGTRLGYVLMTTIEYDGFKLLHSSDIDGPVISSYADYIIKERPDLLILDGYPTYILGYIASYRNLAKAVLNTVKICKHVKNIVLDHHLLRDYRYRDLYYVAYEYAKKHNVDLRSAAELLGKEPKVLEAYRRNGPTKWKKWQRIDKLKLRKLLQTRRI